jgi:hypothetical protein
MVFAVALAAVEVGAAVEMALVMALEIVVVEVAPAVTLVVEIPFTPLLQT